MSGSCRGKETAEGDVVWSGKGLEVSTTHDPVLHMNGRKKEPPHGDSFSIHTLHVSMTSIAKPPMSHPAITLEELLKHVTPQNLHHEIDTGPEVHCAGHRLALPQ